MSTTPSIVGGTTIRIFRGRNGRFRGLWVIDCDRCNMPFTRTKVGIARTWAMAHNDTVHEGMCTIVDETARS